MTSKLIKTVKSIKLNRDKIVTPRIVDYLSTRSDVELTEDMESELLRLMTDDSNSKRDGRFGASSRGTCMRAQLWSYLGMPQTGDVDYVLNNIFMDGKWRHARWQLMGLAAGVFTDVEVSYTEPKYKLGTSIDAINRDEGWLFELKGAHMIPKEVPEKHLLQIHTYFLVTGYDRCSYVVECKRTQEFREWVVSRDDAMMTQVREELETLNGYTDDRKLPPILPECEAKEGAYKRCPYRGASCCVSQTSYPVKARWDD
jgi:hypothetical protein